MNAMTVPQSIPGQTRISQGLPPVLKARDLTSGGTTAVIDLDGQNYTLRITRMGKLILTK